MHLIKCFSLPVFVRSGLAHASQSGQYPTLVTMIVLFNKHKQSKMLLHCSIACIFSCVCFNCMYNHLITIMMHVLVFMKVFHSNFMILAL